MEFKIWDKKESINGVDAREILNSNNSFKESDVVLFLENDVVVRIEDVNILKNVYGIEATDPIEIAKKTYEIQQEQNEQVKEEATTLEKQQEQLKNLEEQNATLTLALIEKGVI